MSTTFDLGQYAETYVEPKAVAADEEYELRIIGADGNRNDNGPYLMARLEVMGESAALDIRMYVGMPGEERDVKGNNRVIKRLYEFCEAFDLPDPLEGQFNPQEDWIGSTGWAILGQEEYQGEIQNTVRKLIAPK